MKLYVTEGSAYALMARVVVREKGLWSRVEIIAARMRLANSSYYGINPSGRVSVAVAERGLEVTPYLWHSWPGTVIPIHPRPAIPKVCMATGRVDGLLRFRNFTAARAI